jgi:hypothetical protein
MQLLKYTNTAKIAECRDGQKLASMKAWHMEPFPKPKKHVREL